MTTTNAASIENDSAKSPELIAAIGRTQRALEDAARLPVDNSALLPALSLYRTALFREEPRLEELEELAGKLGAAAGVYAEHHQKAKEWQHNLRKKMKDKSDQCLDANIAVRKLIHSLQPVDEA